MLVENKMFRPADLYEWALQSLENGELLQDDEAELLNSLRATDWIRQKFETLPEDTLRGFYHEIASSIENEDLPIDILSLSRMYYCFSAMWLDTSRLRDLINSSDYVKKGIETILLKRWAARMT